MKLPEAFFLNAKKERRGKKKKINKEEGTGHTFLNEFVTSPFVQVLKWPKAERLF